VREFVNALRIFPQAQDEMLIAADLVFSVLEPACQGGVVFGRIQLVRKNLKTPPPRFLPIERWISAVKPFQPP
jgi:hypothetical protein